MLVRMLVWMLVRIADEFGDRSNLIVWCIEKLEGISGFVANSGHAECTNVENCIKEAFLLERDILDTLKLDNVCRTAKERSANDLNCAFVCDVHPIVAINNMGTNRDHQDN